ncbi:hypothetical protein H9P43_009302 [Blastocladiella emersonii ATCC 22665]|nr:hypothetical protein H9P43_009302 [Blastocladiella emersonii ATCC 22665]
MTSSSRRRRSSSADRRRGAAGASARSLTRTLLPVNAIEESVFRAAYITTSDNELPPLFSWILTILEDVQWLSFAWNTELMHGVPWVLAAVIEPTRFLTTYASFSAANVVALFLVFTVTSLFALVSYSMHQQKKLPIALLRFLRVLATLLMTVCSIPILTLLVGGLHCVGPNGGTLAGFNVPCTSATHLPLLIFDVLGLVVFIPLTLTGALVFLDNSPTSSSPLARAHGRIDFLAIATRIALVFLDVFRTDIAGDAAGRLAFLALASAGLAYLATIFASRQPYFSAAMTTLRVAMLASASATMLATLVVLAVGAGDEWWLATVPVAAVALAVGALVARWYATHYLARTIRFWHRVCRAEAGMNGAAEGEEAGSLGLAALIREKAAEAAAANDDDGGAGSDEDGGGKRLDGSSDPPCPVILHTRPSVSSEAGTTAAEHHHVHKPNLPAIVASHTSLRAPPPRSPPQQRRLSSAKLAAVTPPNPPKLFSDLLAGTSTDALNIIDERKPRHRTRVFDSPLQVEACLRFLRKNPTPRQVALGLQLLDRGLLEFPHDPLLQLLAATYLAAYYAADGGTAAAADLLRELRSSTATANGKPGNPHGGRRRRVPMDVRFLVYAYDRASRAEGAHVLDRAARDALARDAAESHIAALAALRDFWDAVRNAAPVAALALVIERLAVAQARAGETYVLLLEKHRDKNVLRAYAQFLGSVAADQVRAAQILEVADEIEQQETRARTAMGSQGGGAGAGGRTEPWTRSTGSLNHGPLAGRIATTGGSLPKVSPSSANGPSSSADRLAPLPPRAAAALVRTDGPSPPPPPSELSARPRAASFAQVDTYFPPHDGSGEPHPAELSYEAGSHTLREYAASAGSGTSSSRASRQRTHARRMLLERVSRPLHQAWRVAVASFLFLASVAAGFATCWAFFKSTGFVLDTYSAVRSARTASLLIVEMVRTMVYANVVASPTKFATALNSLKTSGLPVVTNGLPVLAQLEASTAASGLASAKFRVYLARLAPPLIADMVAADQTSLEIVKSVLTAGNLALAYPYAALTPDVFATIPTFRFITDNLVPVFGAIRTLSQGSITQYFVLVENATNQIAACLTASLVLLVVVVAVFHHSVVLRFFANESRVLRLVRALPRSAASAMLTQVEEEMETFREVALGDDDDDDPGIPAASVDYRVGGSGSGAGGSGGGGSGGGAPGNGQRSRKYQLVTLGAATVAAAVVAGMFAVPLQSMSLQMDMQRLMWSSERRFNTITSRVLSLEYFSTQSPIQNLTLVGYMRSAVYDLAANHKNLLDDTNGLQVSLPAHTVWPRDCVGTPTLCPGVTDQPEIGWTRAVASQPMDTEISQFIDVLTRVGDAMANSATVPRDTNGTAARSWQLALAMSTDVQNRLTAIHTAIKDMMAARVADSMAVTAAMFGAACIVSCAGLVGVYLGIVVRLRREAVALTAVLYLIPPAVVAKDAPGLAKLLESGGAQLELSGNSDDV